MPEHPSPPYEGGDCGVSKTLEYCYDDYCLSRFAQKLGLDAHARMFLSRAKNYRNVWDAQTRLHAGTHKTTAHGLLPFYPGEPYYNFMYKESNGVADNLVCSP